MATKRRGTIYEEDAPSQIGNIIVGHTKKIVLGEDYVNKLENDVTPEITTSGIVELNRLKRIVLIILGVFSGLYLIFGVVHLALALTLYPTKTFQATLYTFFTSSSMMNVANPLGSYTLWYVFVTLPLVAILFSVYPIYATAQTDGTSLYNVKKTKPQYLIEVFFVGVDWLMWVENAVAGAILLWCVGQMVGVVDLLLLITLIVSGAVYSLAGGLGMEVANDGVTAHTSRSNKANKASDTVKINWWPLIFGGLLPFLIIVTILFTFMCYTQNSISSRLYVSWILVSVVGISKLLMLFIIFVRYSMTPLDYNLKDSKENVENHFLTRNGNYKIAKSLLMHIERLAVIVLFFAELFLFY